MIKTPSDAFRMAEVVAEPRHIGIDGEAFRRGLGLFDQRLFFALGRRGAGTEAEDQRQQGEEP
jgi:hypothetical protein